MTTESIANAYPALHNAMWPGLVGKGPYSEPPIDLDTMLNLTAAAEVDGVRFDGVDRSSRCPTPISIPPTTTWRVSPRSSRPRDCVPDRWSRRYRPPTGGGSAMGDDAERARFLTQVPQGLPDREETTRPRHPQVRNDPHRFGCQRRGMGQDPAADTRRIAQTFREACTIAEDVGERLAAEDELGGGTIAGAQRGIARDGGPPANPGLPGRHGPHHALHHGL